MPIAPAPTTTMRFGAVGQEQRLAVGDDALAVGLHARQRARIMPGRDDDVLRLDHAVVLLPVHRRRFCRRLHLDLLGRLQRRRALVDVDLVLPHQEADALDQPVADLAAALLRHRVVQLQVVEAEPEILALARSGCSPAPRCAAATWSGCSRCSGRRRPGTRAPPGRPFGPAARRGWRPRSRPVRRR